MFAHYLTPIIATADQEFYEIVVSDFASVPHGDVHSMALFTAMITMNEIDIVAIPPIVLRSYSEGGTLQNMDRILATVAGYSRTAYYDIRQRLVPVTFMPFGAGENASPVTDYMAISMEGSVFMQNLGFITGDIYFIVPINSQRLSAIATALIYINAWG